MLNLPNTNPSPDSLSVLILGARGRLGLAAARAFAQSGWRVHAQVRPVSGAMDPFAGIVGVQQVELPLDDHAALAKAAAGACVVVHAVNPLYTHAQWRTAAPAMLEAAISVSRQLGARLMLPGNVYNFGESMPRELREDTLQKPSTVKGGIRVAMEQRLADAAQQGDMRAVVIRAGNFFGSGRGSWLDQGMANKLKRGRMMYPGTMDVPAPWAYLPDLARSFVQVAQKSDSLPAFDTLHFGGYSLTGNDWVEVLTDIACQQGWLPAGGHLKVGSLPWRLIGLGGWVRPTWAALMDLRYLWHRPHSLVNHKLARVIGAEPRTPFAVAVRTALADLGWLNELPGAANLQASRGS